MAIIPSVVSIPPNSSTAALELTCSVDQRARARRRRASSDESSPPSITDAQPLAAGARTPPRPPPSRRCRRVISVTEATIASYQAEHSATSSRAQARAPG